jgi:hypothetical protein
MVTFHPAYILRQTGGEIEAVKRMVWDDLKAVRAKLEEPPPPLVTLSAVEGRQGDIAQAGLFE